MAITVRELIEKKNLLKQEKEKIITLNVKDFGEFEFKIPTAFDISDAEAYGESGDQEAYLVATCSHNPSFFANDLVDAYRDEGAKTGIDVVKIIFKPGHIRWMYLKLLEVAGYNESLITIIENTKN